MANDGTGNVYVAVDIVGIWGIEGSGNIEVVAAFNEATAISGYVGDGGIDVSVEFSSSSGAGVIGSGGMSVGINLSGSAAHGTAGSGELALSVLLAGPGVQGSTGEGSMSVAVLVHGQLGHGTIGSGSLGVEVWLDGNGFPAMAGSGVIALGVVFAGNGRTRTITPVQLYTMNARNKSIGKHTVMFSSFAIMDGVLYASGPTGLCRIVAGATDNGVIFNSRIAKTGMDMGTGQVKSITEAYLHLTSSGSFTFTASSESMSGAVTVVDSVPYMHACKVNLPRGTKGRNFGWAVESIAGARLKIAEAEFVVAQSTTRRTRQARGQ